MSSKRDSVGSARLAETFGKGAGAAWVHAYLHRKEGDRANAGYWYRAAGRTMPEGSLDAEWEAIAAALLGR